jgi:hypothetical protein
MSICSENIVVVTTTMAGNEISERRRKMMVDTMSAFRIPVFFDHGVTDVGASLIDKQYRIMKSRMEQFMKMPGFEYAVLCDDDFHCHPDFLVELNQTVSMLPPDWRCLHLSPGCLGGRSIFFDKEKWKTFKVGELRPEGGFECLRELEVDSTSRYFKGSLLWNGRCMWLGGPIAVLVRRETIVSLWEDYTRLYVRENNPNDVILTNILGNRDFVCRSPLLGYEDEMGGTCF